LQSKDIINVLKNDEAKSFILNHIIDHYAELSLKYSGKTTYNIAVCLQLMELYKKSKTKIPMVWENLLAIDKRSYEQATAQSVAEYKREFIKGNTLLDVTAGFGVDSIILAKNFKEVTAIERNSELNELAAFNINKLGINNIERIVGDGSDFINQEYDWVYIDPDRRIGAKRGIKLQDLEPNVLELLPKLKKYAKRVYLKLSPMFDVKEVVRVFEHVERIYCISLRNEVKELGVILNFAKKHTKPTIHLHDVASKFDLTATWEDLDTEPNKAIKEFTYLFAPNALLLKSGLSNYYYKKDNIYKHQEFELFFSDSKQKSLEGRCFKILQVGGLSRKEIKKDLQKLNIDKLNIVIKGLSDKPEKWHQLLKTTDGGAYFLIILKGRKKESFICKLLTS
jgi:hypothetical protein